MGGSEGGTEEAILEDLVNSKIEAVGEVST